MGQKIWMNIYSQPAGSKRYASCLSNHPKPCLNNISFRLARDICMIVKTKMLDTSSLKN